MSISALETAHINKSATTSACAKINLTLDVLGRRDDGYHALRSLVIGVDMADSLSMSTRCGDGIELSCSDASLSSSDNLIFRAVNALAGHTNAAARFSANLEKKIPIAAGLGGGSSDAAAALRLANVLGDHQLSDSRLAEIGACVGSDVPLFFSLPVAVMEGRGEVVRAIDWGWSGCVLLVFTGETVSTEKVYGDWRKSDAADMPALGEQAVLNVRSAEAFVALTYNHLERAVFRVAPRVGVVHAALEKSGLGPMRVSGAGSVLYRPFDTTKEAWNVANELKALDLGVTTDVVAAPVGQALEITTKED